jgi:hypothetical protein
LKVLDCERDGWRLWGDQLLFDWLRDENDRETRDRVVAWVILLVEDPESVAGIPVPGTDPPAVCDFVPLADVAVTWIVIRKRCIVWLIEVESLGDLGG